MAQQTTIERLVEIAERRDRTVKCVTCGDAPKGRIPCPAHLVDGETELDLTTGLVWCHNCDTAEPVAPIIICPCWG